MRPVVSLEQRWRPRRCGNTSPWTPQTNAELHRSCTLESSPQWNVLSLSNVRMYQYPLLLQGLVVLSFFVSARWTTFVQHGVAWRLVVVVQFYLLHSLSLFRYDDVGYPLLFPLHPEQCACRDVA